MAEWKEHWIINQRLVCQVQFCVPYETSHILYLRDERHHMYPRLRKIWFPPFLPPALPTTLPQPYHFPAHYFPLIPSFSFSRYLRPLKGLWSSNPGLTPFQFFFFNLKSLLPIWNFLWFFLTEGEGILLFCLFFELLNVTLKCFLTFKIVYSIHITLNH